MIAKYECSLDECELKAVPGRKYCQQHASLEKQGSALVTVFKVVFYSALALVGGAMLLFGICVIALNFNR